MSRVSILRVAGRQDLEHKVIIPVTFLSLDIHSFVRLCTEFPISVTVLLLFQAKVHLKSEFCTRLLGRTTESNATEPREEFFFPV